MGITPRRIGLSIPFRILPEVDAALQSALVHFQFLLGFF